MQQGAADVPDEVPLVEGDGTEHGLCESAVWCEGVRVGGWGDSEGVSDECGRHNISVRLCVCECD